MIFSQIYKKSKKFHLQILFLCGPPYTTNNTTPPLMNFLNMENEKLHVLGYIQQEKKYIYIRDEKRESYKAIFFFFGFEQYKGFFSFPEKIRLLHRNPFFSYIKNRLVYDYLGGVFFLLKIDFFQGQNNQEVSPINFQKRSFSMTHFVNDSFTPSHYFSR